MKTKKIPIDGEWRTKKTFLIIPKTINGITKWFQFVRIRQQYCEWDSDNYTLREWVDRSWF